MLDEVLVVLMRAPRSFTAEDTVEIDCHGGVYAIQRVLEAVIKNGAASGRAGRIYEASLFKWKNGFVPGGGGDGCH